MYGEPEDPLQGKFSSKYNVAAALVDNQIAIDTFSDEKMADPAVQETMKKVRQPCGVQSGGGCGRFQ